MKTLLALVDTYNHERFIVRAVESVLAQTLPWGWRMQAVVVDDGSLDDTSTKLRPFLDRVRYIRKENGGQASAFNQLQSLPDSDVVAFLDGDDYWLPGKAQTVLAEFEADPGLIAVGHGFREVCADERSIREVAPPTRRTYQFSNGAGLRDYLEFRCCLGTSRLAVRRRALVALLPVPEGLVYEADEYWFSLLPALGSVRVLPQVLTAYRLHGGNLYQSANRDPARLRVRKRIHETLRAEVPLKLRGFGASVDVICALERDLDFHVDDLRMALGELSRIEAVRHELTRHRMRTGGPSLALFAALASAALLPSKRHTQFRDWYSRIRNRDSG